MKKMSITVIDGGIDFKIENISNSEIIGVLEIIKHEILLSMDNPKKKKTVKSK